MIAFSYISLKGINKCANRASRRNLCFTASLESSGASVGAVDESEAAFIATLAAQIKQEAKTPTPALDRDDPNHMQWLCKKAQQRARIFGIEGVTYQLTLGVVKRIIPAVASTNAVISAALVQEALKVSTYCGAVMDNYFMFMGHDGVYSHTFSYDKKEDCLVCGISKTLTLVRDPRSTHWPHYTMRNDDKMRIRAIISENSPAHVASNQIGLEVSTIQPSAPETVRDASRQRRKSKVFRAERVSRTRPPQWPCLDP